ncbi:citrate synthase [Devosia submarina]|uniref:citrate synthase n=1 Tax=Devosia submarina TaxID=1173082 RepID=UPI000D3A6C5E|nr:citrate synthase [Devosia submarina]
MADWLSAADALALLGTRPQTLYANVSRGRIKAKPDPKDPRRSLYRGDDVRRLAQRAPGRRKQETVAAETIRWGEPVMQTAISTIADGTLLYRGENAAGLAVWAALEDVAGLLWETDPIKLPRSKAGGNDIADALSLLAGRAASDAPSIGRSAQVLKREAAAVLADIAAALAGTSMVADPLHVRLAATWRRRQAADLIRRALVLLADHELNASTFAARVTASTGASLAASCLSGLATLTGPLHGSAAGAVLILADDAKRNGAEAAINARLAQGLTVPSFGHPLYPSGDMRAQHLISHMVLPPLLRDLAAIGEDITGERPNVDFALAALTFAHDLPREAPLIIFALARSVGWLAHALEQVSGGELIRPRARYVGA